MDFNIIFKPSPLQLKVGRTQSSTFMSFEPTAAYTIRNVHAAGWQALLHSAGSGKTAL